MSLLPRKRSSLQFVDHLCREECCIIRNTQLKVSVQLVISSEPWNWATPSRLHGSSSDTLAFNPLNATKIIISNFLYALLVYGVNISVSCWMQTERLSSLPLCSECSDFSPGVSVLLLIFLCLEAILFLTFTAVMFGTQIHSICNDETVSVPPPPLPATFTSFTGFRSFVSKSRFLFISF